MVAFKLNHHFRAPWFLLLVLTCVHFLTLHIAAQHRSDEALSGNKTRLCQKGRRHHAAILRRVRQPGGQKVEQLNESSYKYRLFDDPKNVTTYSIYTKVSSSQPGPESIVQDKLASNRYLHHVAISATGQVYLTWRHSWPTSIRILVTNEDGSSYVGEASESTDNFAFYRMLLEATYNPDQCLRELIRPVTRTFHDNKHYLVHEITGNHSVRFWSQSGVNGYQHIDVVSKETESGSSIEYWDTVVLLGSNVTVRTWPLPLRSGIKFVIDDGGSETRQGYIREGSDNLALFIKLHDATKSPDSSLRKHISRTLTVNEQLFYLHTEFLYGESYVQAWGTVEQVSQDSEIKLVTRRRNNHMQYLKESKVITLSSMTNVWSDFPGFTFSTFLSADKSGTVSPTSVSQRTLLGYVLIDNERTAHGTRSARPKDATTSTSKPTEDATTPTVKPTEDATTPTVKPAEDDTTPTLKPAEDDTTSTPKPETTVTEMPANSGRSDVSIIRAEFGSFVSIPRLRLWVAPEYYLDPVLDLHKFISVAKFASLLQLSDDQQEIEVLRLFPQLQGLPRSLRAATVEDAVGMSATQRHQWCAATEARGDPLLSERCTSACHQIVHSGTVLFAKHLETQYPFCKFGRGFRVPFLWQLLLASLVLVLLNK